MATIDIEAQVQELRMQLAELQHRLDAAEARSDPRGAHATIAPTDTVGTDAGEPTHGAEPTDRREVLRRAGAMAAGAAAGGAAIVLGTASPAAAAPGSFDGSPAVLATGVGGYGLQATSDTTSAIRATTSTFGDTVSVINSYAGNGRGVYASGQTCGVFGVCPTGAGSGVQGTSYQGYGVSAEVNASTARAQLILGGLAPLPAPPTRTDFHLAGEIAFDGNRDLWLCVTQGYPGTWRRLSGTASAGALTLLTSPVRIYDSRPGNPPATGPKTPLGGGTSRTLDCTNNASGVPVGATGVLANITVVNTSTTGYLAAYKTGTGVPGSSTINWFQAGTIVANTTVVACDATAHIDCFVPASSSTDFLVDVIGYTR